ncbi:MAG: Aminomethyltransferase, mitochondrial [Claussenomyces sp. TS43310]|nr:MAG: Aminomethyltransferase, mitochondrial [Claussenomyces sp. TS43310]
MKRMRASRSIGNAIAQQPRLTPQRFGSTLCARTHSSELPRAQACLRAPTSRFQVPVAPSCHRHASGISLSSETLQKTPLYELHVAHGGKMVPFGGFQMPVQYDSLSVLASHHFTRSHSSLFDVGHMVQHRFSGPGATTFLQSITPAGLASLPSHQSTLSTLLWPVTGGIVDDTIITRLGPELFYVVTNAGCREKDLKYFTEELQRFASSGEGKVDWEVLNGWGLIALQGPLSSEVLERLLVDPGKVNLKELYFGQSRFANLILEGGKTSSPVLISRGGYTGEDGFEISIQPEDTVPVTEALLAAGPEKVQLAGLGARDSLRLEAGMCLYGHDLDDSTTPVEAALAWVIGKDRRVEGGFHGADKILAQLKPQSKGGEGVRRRRVGLIVEGAPAREGAEIVNEADEKIGAITSGCPSPTLGKNIAMGYIKDGMHKSGTAVGVKVRGKKRAATVTKMPFVASKYWKGAAPA